MLTKIGVSSDCEIIVGWYFSELNGGAGELYRKKGKKQGTKLMNQDQFYSYISFGKKCQTMRSNKCKLYTSLVNQETKKKAFLPDI